MKHTVILGWGRMQPPTIGHEKLVNKIEYLALKYNADSKVYLTHTRDKRKNPLTYDQKVALATEAFGDVIQRSSSRTIMQVLQELEKTYNNLYMIVGSDRKDEFETLLNTYNGTEYKFNQIDVLSAGDRDPDSNDESGISATKMRDYAKSGDIQQFKAGLPIRIQNKAKEIIEIINNSGAK